MTEMDFGAPLNDEKNAPAHFVARRGAAVLQLGDIWGRIGMTSSVDLAKLHIDDFAAHVDSLFELQAADGVVPLKLAKVEPAGNSGRPGGAFSLLFTGPKGESLPQGIYQVRHPALSTMEIFVVPLGPRADGNGYQAIFT